MTGFEEKIIEIYEQVAIQAITPNEARKRFNSAVSELVEACIGEDDEDDEGAMSVYGKSQQIQRNQLRAEIRQRFNDALGS